MESAVLGSLLVDAGLKKITFLKTGEILAPGDYTLRLKSGSEAFHDLAGQRLDGNADGTAGDDYTRTLTIDGPTTPVIIGLPDVTRGAGQPVNLPANNLAAGLPLSITNGTGVAGIDLRLQYDPALLEIPDFTLDQVPCANLAADGMPH